MRNSSVEGLVSIILPVYNGESFLKQALVHILRQEYTNVELIAIDDASRDGSWEILRSIRDPRIRLARHRKNRGIATVRNTGLRLARGEFVTFCDQDDILTYHSISGRVLFLRRHPEAQSVFGRVVHVQKYGGRLVRIRIPKVDRYYRFYRKLGLIPLDLLQHEAAFPGSLTSHLLRRNLVIQVGLLDPRWRLVDDWEYAVRVAKISEPRFIDTPVIWHWYHDQNSAETFAGGLVRAKAAFVKEHHLLLKWFRQKDACKDS